MRNLVDNKKVENKKVENKPNIKYLINKLVKFKQWILSIIISFFDLALVGFLIIFASFGIFGETIMWSWQMWCKILGVAVGGTILIQYGKNCR